MACVEYFYSGDRKPDNEAETLPCKILMSCKILNIYMEIWNGLEIKQNKERRQRGLAKSYYFPQILIKSKMSIIP